MAKHNFGVSNQEYPSSVALDRGRLALTNEDVDGSGAILAGTTTGGPVAYLLTLSFLGLQLPSAVLNNGLRILVNFNVNNTGSATINVNAPIGVKDIKRFDGSVLQADDLVSGRLTDLVYNSAEGHWRLAFQTPSIIQIVHTPFGAVATGTVEMIVDDSLPQNDEGDEYMTQVITPTNANHKLLIEVSWYGAHSTTVGAMVMALFKNSDVDAISVSWGPKEGSVDSPAQMKMSHEITAGGTSAITFKTRVGAVGAGTTTFNGNSSVRRFGGVLNSYMRITEIKA